MDNAYYNFPYDIPKQRNTSEITKLINEIMAHQEMMDKLQDKIFEAEKALEKSSDETRANLERLIQEMKDLRREMSEKGESFAEKFKGQTADLIRRVSDMVRGDKMPGDEETVM